MEDKFSGYDIDNMLRDNIGNIFGIPADNNLNNSAGSSAADKASCGCGSNSAGSGSLNGHTVSSCNGETVSGSGNNADAGGCGCENHFAESSMPGSICVGYGYVPWQMLNRVYQPEEGLDQGTVFPELDLSISEYGKVCKSGGY